MDLETVNMNAYETNKAAFKKKVAIALKKWATAGTIEKNELISWHQELGIKFSVDAITGQWHKVAQKHFNSLGENKLYLNMIKARFASVGASKGDKVNLATGEITILPKDPTPETEDYTETANKSSQSLTFLNAKGEDITAETWDQLKTAQLEKQNAQQQEAMDQIFGKGYTQSNLPGAGTADPTGKLKGKIGYNVKLTVSKNEGFQPVVTKNGGMVVDTETTPVNPWERKRVRELITTVGNKLVGIHLQPDEAIELVRHIRRCTFPDVLLATWDIGGVKTTYDSRDPKQSAINASERRIKYDQDE